MKTRTKFFAVLVVLLAGVLALAACGSRVSAQEGAVPQVRGDAPSRGGQGRGYGNVARVGDDGNARIDSGVLRGALDRPIAAELSDVEAEGILYMREEEKLARDVYLTLYDQWGMQILSNIADSESTHMEAVKTLIDRYGLDDPAAGKGIGEFTNEELKALYDQLVEQGSQSLVDALQVGAAIEEIDILDL
jgi:hypothetical protein